MLDTFKKKYSKPFFYLCSIFFLLFGFVFSVKPIKAAPCPVGGSVTLTVSCEIDGSASYTDLTIPAGVTVTSSVGQKTIIIVSGTMSIQAGGGIDVSGKGNNSAGAGGNGSTSGTGGCTGLFGSGGGGGGYGGTGGAGATDGYQSGGAGGIAYGSNTSPSDLGSLGGIGGGNSAGNGLGGGAVKISAKNIIFNGFIRANGSNGVDAVGNDGTGAGGGGSGGSIWLLVSDSFDFTGGTVEAIGGAGGVDVNCGGWDGAGGGGSGGRVSLQYKGPKIGSGTYNIAAGAGGGGPLPGAAGNAGTFNEDPCFFQNCAGYCTGAGNMIGYSGGSCSPITGSCSYATIQNCVDTDDCTYDTCEAGLCGNDRLCGGIVPCGRLVDNPVTPYDEKSSCTLCHIFIMLQIISTFVVEISAIVAVFFIIIGGLIYATSAGDQSRMEMGKKAVTWAIFGLAVILLSWLVVTIVLTALGYINPLGGQWNIVNCSV